jgi:hypothetical protein
MAAIETNGLHTLSDFLPKKPSEVELQCIKEMFEASVDGQPYDVERWGQYYRPYGIDAPAGSSTSSTSTATAAPATPAPAPAATPSPIAAAPAPAPQVETVAAPAAAPEGESKRAEDILAMIRNRQS